MSHADNDYDYTKEETPFDANPGDDYEISEGAVAPTATAEDIERDSGFKPIPVGKEQELIVIGFLVTKDSKTPVVHQYKDCFFGSRRESFEVDVVTVKLALVSDQSCQVLERFVLPPGDPHGTKCYLESTSKPDGKPGLKGFDAKKTFHFLERLGYVWPRGGKLPEDARKLKNWIGKKIIADIVQGKPYTKEVFDKDSGMKTTKEFPGNVQVGLFTYRLHPDTVDQFRRASDLLPNEPRVSTPASASIPSPVAPQPKRAETRKTVAVQSGLDDI